MPTQLLVLEDSPLERQRIRCLFDAELPEAEVHFADNVPTVLNSLSITNASLIVSCAKSHDVDSLNLVEELRKAEQNIPVVLVTERGSEVVAVPALIAGASSFVSKSELETDLVPLVKNLLAISQIRHNRRRVLDDLTSAEIRYTIENDITLVSPLISHMLDQISTMKLLETRQLTRLGVALQEALSNAIYHGNLELDSELRQGDQPLYHALAAQRRQESPYRERRVSVIAKLSRREVRFTITDGGPGFDYKSRLVSAASIGPEQIGGRGLLLIRSFMDHVGFNDRGNELTMGMYSIASGHDLDHPHRGPHSRGATDSLLSMPPASYLI